MSPFPPIEDPDEGEPPAVPPPAARTEVPAPGDGSGRGQASDPGPRAGPGHASDSDPGHASATGHASEPAWLRDELGWPLSLFAGFGGTWAGLASGVPGLSVLVTTACLAPLVLGLQNRGRGRRALVLALGGVVGAAGAVVGAVLEGGLGEVEPLLPGARAARSGLTSLLAGGSGGAPLARLVRQAGPVLAGLALARATRGLIPLAVALAVATAQAAAVAERAAASGLGGGSRLVPLVVGWPPGALLEVAGLLALGMALGRVPGTPPPSTQLRAGCAALALSPLAWWLAPAWARLVGPALTP